MPFLGEGLHIQKIEERRKDIMDYVKAFVVGGIICAIVQILMEKTKLMPGRIMVMLVCTGALLGAVGIYGPFSKWAGAGANVPLLGFGNVLWKGVKEAVDSEGFIQLNELDRFHPNFLNQSCIAIRNPYHIVQTKYLLTQIYCFPLCSFVFLCQPIYFLSFLYSISV